MSKICDLCKTENDDENQFCEKCGNPLGESAGGKVTEEKEEEPVAPSGGGMDIKFLILIPLVLILAIGGYFGYNYYQTNKKKKAAVAVVESYLTKVKEGKYKEALKESMNFDLTPKWEQAFKDFVQQILPSDSSNENLYQAKVALVKIADAIERYYYIERKFPPTLNDLTPVIMKKLPSLPCGEYGYEYDNNTENYTIYIKGNVFEKNGLQENYPAYSRKDKLQCPGEKKIFSSWQITGFEILSAEVYGDKVWVKVKEKSKFGNINKVSEETYIVSKKGERWFISKKSIGINPTTNRLMLAFTQMESLTAPKKEPEKKNNKKSKKKSKKKGEKEEKKPQKKKFKPPEISLGMFLAGFTKIASNDEYLKLRKMYLLRKCRGALESIGLALEAYSRDNDGKYPRSLQWLIPKYIKRIPENPAAMEDTFTQGYECSENQDVFTVYSKGDYYKDVGVPENFPQYSSLYRYISTPQDLRQKEAEKEQEIIEREDLESTPPEGSPQGEESSNMEEEKSPTPPEESPEKEKQVSKPEEGASPPPEKDIKETPPPKKDKTQNREKPSQDEKGKAAQPNENPKDNNSKQENNSNNPPPNSEEKPKSI